MQLLESNKAKAVDYFRNCIATDVKHFGEYASALVELEHL